LGPTLNFACAGCRFGSMTLIEERLLPITPDDIRAWRAAHEFAGG
jgi:hypothetical protein